MNTGGKVLEEKQQLSIEEKAGHRDSYKNKIRKIFSLFNILVFILININFSVFRLIIISFIALIIDLIAEYHLLKKYDAKTYLKGRCPNCGNQIIMADEANSTRKCKHCLSLIILNG